MHYFVPNTRNTLPIYFRVFRGELTRYVVCSLSHYHEIKKNAFGFSFILPQLITAHIRANLYNPFNRP